MAQNCQNQRKTDISVLIPASHNPSTKATQLCIMTAHTQTLCIGKGRRVINYSLQNTAVYMVRLERATSCAQCVRGMSPRKL